jgi:hypothetical protein
MLLSFLGLYEHGSTMAVTNQQKNEIGFPFNRYTHSVTLANTALQGSVIPLAFDPAWPISGE